MNKLVQRYSIDEGCQDPRCEMEASDSGAWVMWEDVEPLLKASPPSGGEVYQRLAQIAVYGDVWFDISRETYEATKESGITRILYTSPGVVDEALRVAQQALMEVAHAQEVGPQWYSRGESGLRNQVDMWVRKGLTALQAALELNR